MPRFYVMKEIEGEDCLMAERPTVELAEQELRERCATALDEEVWSVWSSAEGIVIWHQRAIDFRERWRYAPGSQRTAK